VLWVKEDDNEEDIDEEDSSEDNEDSDDEEARDQLSSACLNLTDSRALSTVWAMMVSKLGLNFVSRVKAMSRSAET